MPVRKYRIIVIDDDRTVPFTQQRIGHSVMRGECEIINLTDTDCLNSRTKKNGVFNGLSDSFKVLLRDTTIDIIACDVNLGDGSSDNGMHMRILDEIKKINKTLKILSYSGDIGSQIISSIVSGGKIIPSKVTNVLKILLNHCDGFEERGTNVVSRLNELLSERRDGIELEYVLENSYPENTYIFKDGKSVKGKEIAKLIRSGNDKGIEFVNRAVEFGIDNISALFS